MWVEMFFPFSLYSVPLVILLVRMWVEIYNNVARSISGQLSSSSWGCELKYRDMIQNQIEKLVILLVRMWVEMNTSHLSWQLLQGHPPCEDVSWNKHFFNIIRRYTVILLVRMWVEMLQPTSFCWFRKSSSLWGCELKYHVTEYTHAKHLSSSLWGCELKYSIPASFPVACCHPPCEDVSWN